MHSPMDFRIKIRIKISLPMLHGDFTNRVVFLGKSQQESEVIPKNTTLNVNYQRFF